MANYRFLAFLFEALFKRKAIPVKEIKEKFSKEGIIKDLNSILHELKFISQYEIDIDLKSIFEKLEWSFWDILKETVYILSRTLSVVAAFIINPLFGIFVGLLNIVSKFLDWLFGGEKKAKAKREANIKIENQIKKVRQDLDKTLSNALKRIESNFNETIKQIENYEQKIKKLLDFLTDLIEDVEKIHIKTGTLFLKLLDSSVQLGYIRTNINGKTYIAVITSNPEDVIVKLHAIGLDNVFTYDFLVDLEWQDKHSNGKFFEDLRKIVDKYNYDLLPL